MAGAQLGRMKPSAYRPLARGCVAAADRTPLGRLALGGIRPTAVQHWLTELGRGRLT